MVFIQHIIGASIEPKKEKTTQEKGIKHKGVK